MQNKILEGYPIAPQQKHLWLLQQDSLSSSFRADCTVLIEGNLNLKILETVLENVVSKHEILRTSFPYLNGMTIPLQAINDSGKTSIQHYDLSKWESSEQDLRVGELIDELRELLFDFDKDSLFRVAVITLSANKHILFLCLSAMIADTVTIKNLADEIINLYIAYLQKEDLNHHEPFQYADFAAWQNELVESDATEAGREYWQQQDISNAFTLKLPFENITSQNQTFSAKVVNIQLENSLFAEIKILTNKYNISHSNFLLACWLVLLWRITGQQRVVISHAFDGRKYEELEKAFGLFAKYLPLNCAIEENYTISKVIQQVQANIQDIDKWQEYFNWEIKENKIYFLPFGFEFEDRTGKYIADDISISVVQQYVCFEQFKVKLHCVNQDDALTIEFHYDSNLFSRETIDNLASQFQSLLENTTKNPEISVSNLEILNTHASQQLLVEFNKTYHDYGDAECIHHLFVKQADSTPNNIAVVFENQHLTYSELNAQANQVAHYLQQRGVGKEVVVGLFVERSLDLIVGLLGILKAGGAYLPLDPALPTENLVFRLQDAEATVVLTQEHLLARLGEYQTQAVCLDTQWSAIAAQSSDNPISDVTSENLAYVLFTSGSTGKPKGVSVEHQQLCNYLKAILEKLDLADCTSFANVSTFAADLGNTTIFSSLCTGGCLHLISQQQAADPEALAEYFHQHSIDCLKIVPSHLEALLSCSHPKWIIPKQRLILGGEACSWKLIESLQELAPECLIFNHYGPTETTIGVLTYHIQPKKTNRNSATVPLGRPIANTQIYLLDSQQRPVPIGIPGEIYIGGAGLARGYLNRPELTAQKFVSNPFGLGRLYKTGDVARYQPDGNIEFIGRVDNQVKIRGFRIELEEIETVLSKHSGVNKTVVLAYEESGNKRLVAYIVPEQNLNPTTNELRGFLQSHLPEYMIPAVFMRLKAIPLTPNGKVDRQALPAPDISRLEGGENFVAPRTSVEQKLAQLWTQVLGIEEVSIYDNFFELGGDSILSMQIIAKARQAGLQLTPKHIFDHQTIAELAAVAQNNKVIQAEQGLITGEIPLTPIQQWFFAQNQPDSHHWNQAICLELRQNLDPVLLQEALEQLLIHHDALRMQFVCRESGWQQFNASSDQTKAFTYIDLSSLSPENQKLTIEATTNQLQTSLNLSQGELVQVALFNLGVDKPMRLLLIIHHLVVDGVSWRVLLEDLQTAYEHLSRNESVHLPAKTTSFKEWAEKLQEYASSSALQSELKYWLAQSERQSSKIPLDFPEDIAKNTLADARNISVALSVEETQALLQVVPAAYQTQINDVFLTALAQVYKQWTGCNYLLIDLEGHGREEIFDDVDLSRTVGWFTTIFPVLLDLEETSNVGEALKGVKTQLRAIPNRGIGYGVLRYLSHDKEIIEKLQTKPQAEIRFNYLGQSDQVLTESSLFAAALEVDGNSCSLSGRRSYLVDINGIIVDGKLQLDWTYSQAIHRRETIEAIATSFIEILRSLIAHCQSVKVKIGKSVQPSPDTSSQTELSKLIADSALDPTINCTHLAVNTQEPTKIFLTGATGFLGAFLLDELLQHTSADIYCLVRAENIESTRDRLQRNLESYLIWNPSLSDRIIPVVGDLSQPLLGLSQEQFDLLANEIDVIYHNGALINLVYPYSVLKASNVLGTQEILRLASQVKVKPVHYISTLAVLPSGNSKIPYTGYAQTKWVAEKLITAARERGIPTSIYRLGRVSGHSQSGVCNTSDRLYRMIKGFIELGTVPDVDTVIDMTPVNYVSEAIVYLSKQQKSLGQIFHICNPNPINLSELVNFIGSFGYPIQKALNNQWQTDMLNNPEQFQDNPLYTLIPFFAGTESESANQTETLNETCNSELFSLQFQKTLNELANVAIKCPAINNELLKTYFSYLIKIGFLDHPKLTVSTS
jgi:amino acid adenylation domain-containing protein/thioester reductase-like protein/non-ribosomal peptide synthase protein (TIGR01720 family)